MISEGRELTASHYSLQSCRNTSLKFPILYPHRQYNDRRKIASSLSNTIRERMATEMNEDKDCFFVDSKSIEVYRFPEPNVTV